MSPLSGTPVIVLGMGRSGTSYLVHLLNSMGVNLGSDFIPPGEINPRGFYEDKEVVAFHQSLLKRLRPGAHWDDPLGDLLQDFEPAPKDTEQAQKILRRLSQTGLWGWKDPRTVHFIRFWLNLLPHAKLVVPLRHPLDVFYSYMKRLAGAELVMDTGRLFTSYAAYHTRILEAIEQNENHALVVYTASGYADPAALCRHVMEFLNMSGRDPSVVAAFHASEFSQSSITAPASAIFAALFPEAAAVFERLNSKAIFRLVPGPASPELSSVFSHVLAAVRASGGSTTRTSWLPVLVDLCRPNQSDGYFALQGRALARALETNDRLQAQLTSAEEQLNSHVAIVKELEQAKDFWIQQAELMREQLTSHAEATKEQAEWIRELEQAKEFATQQAESMREQLTSHVARIEEQAEWIRELERAKQFWIKQAESNASS